MNTGPDREMTLDDILHAFIETVPEPSVVDLTDWIRRYPQFRQELIDFTASRELMQWLPDEDIAPVNSTALATRGRSVVRDLLQRNQERRAADETPPISLSDAGTKRGQTIHQLAEQAGLSVPLWRMLDRRLVRGVPDAVIGSVAQTIGVTPSAVARYLQQPAMLVSSALHRSATTPTLAAAEDFFEAVRQDVTLSEDRRSRLLALEQDDVTADGPDGGG